MRPAFPRRIVMATGEEGGAYAEYGERYRRFIEQEGVKLTVRHTPGSVENLALLQQRESEVGIALVQSGLTSPQQSPDLVSLGTVSVEPVWIFCRRELAVLARFEELRGRRVSIGPPGSGMRSLALELLARSGITENNTKLLSLTAGTAASRLLAGEIDAVIIVASVEAPAVRRLLSSPAVGLLPLIHVDAYAALYPYLARVVLPAGFADLAENRPAADVPMVAVKTDLVVRRDLPPAVQYLLLEASRQIHSGAGVFQKAGEFPAEEVTDLPLSEVARQFYRSGPPLLQRELPLWLAVLLAQLATALLPAAALAYPLLRVPPMIYGWRSRRRIAMTYEELIQLETAAEQQSGEQRAAALAALSRMEQRTAHLHLSASQAPLLYALRRDIGFARAELAGMRPNRQTLPVSRTAGQTGRPPSS